MNQLKLIAIQTLAAVSSCSATVYYVSETGIDSASGTLNAPYQTIARAIQQAQNGDSIQLFEGTYRETVLPKRSGVTIEAKDPSRRPVITALDPVVGTWELVDPNARIFAVQQALNSSAPLSVNYWNFGVRGSGGTQSGGKLKIPVKVQNASWGGNQVFGGKPMSELDFFQREVTWRIREMDLANTGGSQLSLNTAVARFSFTSDAAHGWGAKSSVNVQVMRTADGTVNMSLCLKKGGQASWGVPVGSISAKGIAGFDVTLSPAVGGYVKYNLTAYPGGQLVAQGSWAVTPADWTEGAKPRSTVLSLYADWYDPKPQSGELTLSVGSSEILVKGPQGQQQVLFDAFDRAVTKYTPLNLNPIANNPTSADLYLSSDDPSEGFDQIFVNGSMVDEARFPSKLSADLMAPDGAEVTMDSSYRVSGRTFDSLKPADVVGARFAGRIGQGWAWQSSVIQSKIGAQFQLDARQSTRDWWWPQQTGDTSANGFAYLVGKRAFIDRTTNDQEWVLERNSADEQILLLRLKDGADPSAAKVERKSRNWCVLVDGLERLSFRGINFKGGALLLNGSNLLLENCEVSHSNHFQKLATGWGANSRKEEAGVALDGTGNTVRGCTISNAAGGGISAKGLGHTISRNDIYNISYAGSYHSPISLTGGSGHIVSFNNIHDFGRDGIYMSGGAGQCVVYNDIWAGGRSCYDWGSIYSYGSDATAADGRCTRISYNWLHDPTSRGGFGVYLDNGSRNFLVDHNVVWNSNREVASFGGLQANAPSVGNCFYHNTLVGVSSYNESTYCDSPEISTTPWKSAGYHGITQTGQNNLKIEAARAGDAFVNFVARDFRPKAGFVFSDSRFPSVSFSAVNPTKTTAKIEWIKPSSVVPDRWGMLPNPYLNVQIASDEAALTFFYRETIGQGVLIPGVNDGVRGKNPASGAYEPDVTPWKPGKNGVASANQ
ncbi:MAG: right-handed parallel beta-helix repeat-containing protein [Verrucomicrobiota bacterium]